MEHKQIFRVRQPMSSKIVAITDSVTSYVDAGFVRDKMGELEKNSKEGETYPVKVQALKVGWIFDVEKEEHALEFFDALLSNANLEYFKIDGLQILIEFLYRIFQNFMLKIYPPFFIFSMALGYYIILYEQYRGLHSIK